ncbi:MAG: fibronectin type III domain-containing protein [Candidatus Acidiferrales bacterium]
METRNGDTVPGACPARRPLYQPVPSANHNNLAQPFRALRVPANLPERPEAAAPACRPGPASAVLIFDFLFSIFLFSLLLVGCAAPGEPTERRPPVPTTVSDLIAQQSGNAVVLTFKLPRETVQRRPLKSAPAVEIYREFVPAAALPNAPMTARAASKRSGLAPLFTVPPAMVAQYVNDDRFRFVDTLTASDFSLHPDSQVLYMIRTRTSEKQTSAASNSAIVRIHPGFDSISDAKAEVMHSAIALSWTAPQKAIDGSIPPLTGYRIYRAELSPPVAAPPAKSDSPVGAVNSRAASALKLKAPFVRIADIDPTATSYRDSNFEFDVPYVYSIRSIAHYPDAELESSDSNFVLVTPKDVFPPAAPQGLEVVFVPAQPDSRAHLDLSWAISPENDIAGYNVYRNEQEETGGTRINPALLPAPSFRDMNAESGRRYFYSVTAVDRAGNESPSSSVVSGSMPAESQQH